MTTTLVDPVTATHLHGRDLVRWLEERFVVEPESTPTFLSATHRQNLNAWRRGEDAEIVTADRVLVQLDIRIEELPDELLLQKEAPKSEISTEIQERILSLRKLDWSFREIGAMVGVNRDTVRRHVRKAGLA